MAKNVLELNGKRYDAITGAFLGTSTTEPETAAAPAQKPAVRQAAKGKVIDGFIRPAGTAAQAAKPSRPTSVKTTAKTSVKTGDKPAQKQAARAVAPSAKAMHSAAKALEHAAEAAKAAPVTAAAQPKPTPTAPTKVEKIVAEAAAHSVPVHVAGRKPQKSKTLMRRAVHKPEIAMKPAIKPQAPAEIAAKDASALAPKPSALQVDEQRLERAQSVHKSQGIRHFQPARPDFTPTAIETTPRPHTTIVPAIAVAKAPAITPVRAGHTDIFEAALARADSHKQPHVEPAKKHHTYRRLVNLSAGIAAFLIIGGFIGYINMPNIQLHVASIQAGFTANMPAYKPEGYALKGGVQRIGNTVSMRFTSGENNYTVTQQPSDWNSQTLIDNTVALASGSYKTVQAGGRNVYVYGGSNAVWVDGGVRYDLTANTPLSTADITQLAASL